jgi:GT2 family glycosyltransferase
MNIAPEKYSWPTISVIVLNYNGQRYLDNCFDSLSKLSYPKSNLEIILVDNASTDESVAYVKKKYPWVILAKLEKNYGFTGGNNAGAKLAKGEYVVFLNNDVIVTENWLGELVKTLLKNPNAVLTSKSLFLDKPEIIDHIGSKATIIGRSFCLNFGGKDSQAQKTPQFVIQPYGASMLVKKELFRKIGMFDEDYVTSLEDTDFGLRAWLYGYEVIYVPTSVFFHVGGGTGGWGNKISALMTFHVTKNSYQNILKYYDYIHVSAGIAFSILYYAVMILNSIKDGQKNSARYIVKAHIWVLRNLKSIIQKRLEIQTKSVKSKNILFKSHFFASLPEMIEEYYHIQQLYRIHNA